jgi:hypothetical protein
VDVLAGNNPDDERRSSLMGNIVDFRKCESLDRSRQRLTEPEQEKLEELLRTVGEDE